VTRGVFQKFREDGQSPKELLTVWSAEKMLNFQGENGYRQDNFGCSAGIANPVGAAEGCDLLIF
jgi:hypothetical protein